MFKKKKWVIAKMTTLTEIYKENSSQNFYESASSRTAPHCETGRDIFLPTPTVNLLISELAETKRSTYVPRTTNSS